MFNEYQHLRIPGLTPIAPEVQRAMDCTILGEASEKAKCIFQTEEDVYIVASSGTGALIYRK